MHHIYRVISQGEQGISNASFFLWLYIFNVELVILDWRREHYFYRFLKILQILTFMLKTSWPIPINPVEAKLWVCVSAKRHRLHWRICQPDCTKKNPPLPRGYAVTTAADLCFIYSGNSKKKGNEAGTCRKTSKSYGRNSSFALSSSLFSRIFGSSQAWVTKLFQYEEAGPKPIDSHNPCVTMLSCLGKHRQTHVYFGLKPAETSSLPGV